LLNKAENKYGRNMDELRIAAEIVKYHFLRSRQKELIFHMHPSCESKQEIGRKDVINYNCLKENNKPTINYSYK